MVLKDFFAILTNSIRKEGTMSFNYPAVVTASDVVLNRIALDWGMITLPKGRTYDPSEHWIFAQEEK